MLIHAVYVWWNDDVSDKQRAEHLDALRGLSSIEGVRHFHLGVPASTDRPVIERGYSFALIVEFDDETALDAYRSHPRHRALRDVVAAFWRKQVVYDSVEPERSSAETT